MDDKILEAQLKRVITRLFKEFLITMEDIRQDHLGALASLSQFPKEFQQKFNYLDLPKYSRLRKRVLDSGNDAIREMETILKEFKIQSNL